MNIRVAELEDLEAVVEIYNQAISAGEKTADITPFSLLVDSNRDSIRLPEKYGFEKWGHMPQVAEFDGIEFDHLYYGLRI